MMAGIATEDMVGERLGSAFARCSFGGPETQSCCELAFERNGRSTWALQQFAPTLIIRLTCEDWSLCAAEK